MQPLLQGRVRPGAGKTFRQEKVKTQRQPAAVIQASFTLPMAKTQKQSVNSKVNKPKKEELYYDADF